jgi:FAD/FMN-containing dehydrogenase
MSTKSKKQTQKPSKKTLLNSPWKFVFLLILIVVGAVIGRPLVHLAFTALNDRHDLKPVPAGYGNDASKMSQTAINQTVDIPSDPVQAENQIRTLLKKARQENLKVSIAGARHSMGGHTLYPGGIVLNMLPFNHMKLDKKRSILKVGSGARWSDIIPYLRAQGFSVAVMQSNNPFTVGGSISVNCHGWQPNHSPIASTVDSFRLMKADGAVVSCSRTENRELFSLALGGYGLFGVILDVNLMVVPDEVYKPERFIMPVEKYYEMFKEKVAQNPNVGMAYGRLCIAPEHFTDEAILTVLNRVPGKDPAITPATGSLITFIKRVIFRGSIGSEYGKNLRWNLEKVLGEQMGSEETTRNAILNDDLQVFENYSNDSTELLHEYFVPVARLKEFTDKVKVLVPQYKADLLNITIRDLRPDNDTFMRYANQDMFALVMLFHMNRTPEADKQMEVFTQAMIQAALDTGGRYYLPYRLHATQAQFEQAYPRAKKFFALKHKYDPDQIFQNEFYQKYALGKTN